jgi:thiamine-monophosphate kinase
VDVTAIGHVHPRKLLRRASARAGDALYVSGQPGAAAAGLAWLQARCAAGEALDPQEGTDTASAVARYRRPEPRVRLGLLVGRTRCASACMDLSDGLGDAVAQLAQASGLGAVLDLDAVPWHPAAGPAASETALAAALASDDYELLFAVPPRRRRAFARVTAFAGLPPMTRVGELRKGGGILARRDGAEAPLPGGYAHFGDRRAQGG